MARRLAFVAEYRDDDTGQHTQRVGRTAVRLGEVIGLAEGTLACLSVAAPLHDIGKVAIPDAILLKPGPLTERELRIVRNHTVIGAEMLADSQSSILQMGCDIARSHHERWDGKGYPDGTAGEAIPLAARIVAIADVFDALTQSRPYKRRWPLELAVREIANGSGTQFDPTLADAFMELDHTALTAQAGDPDMARARRARGRLMYGAR